MISYVCYEPPTPWGGLTALFILAYDTSIQGPLFAGMASFIVLDRLLHTGLAL
jgi:hypothetical protein